MAGFDDSAAYNEGIPDGGIHPSTIDTAIQPQWTAIRARLCDTVAGTTYAEHEGYTNSTTWPSLYHKEGSGRCFYDTAANKPALAADHSATGITIREGHIYYESDTRKLFIMGADWIQVGGASHDLSSGLATYATGTVTIAEDTSLEGSGVTWNTPATSGITTNSFVAIAETSGGAVTRWYSIASIDDVDSITLGETTKTSGSALAYVIYNGSHVQYLPLGGGTINGAMTFRDNDITVNGANITMSGSETVDGVDVSAHDHSGAGQGGTVDVVNLIGGGLTTAAFGSYVGSGSGDTVITTTGVHPEMLLIAGVTTGTGGATGIAWWYATDDGFLAGLGGTGLTRYDFPTYGGVKSHTDGSFTVSFKAAVNFYDLSDSTVTYHWICWGTAV